MPTRLEDSGQAGAIAAIEADVELFLAGWGEDSDRRLTSDGARQLVSMLLGHERIDEAYREFKNRAENF